MRYEAFLRCHEGLSVFYHEYTQKTWMITNVLSLINKALSGIFIRVSEVSK